MAGETVLERIRRLGLACEPRYDLIGYASVFDGDTGEMRRGSAAEPAEVRLRVAARRADRAVADRVGGEVLALYCCGPAGRSGEVGRGSGKERHGQAG